MSLSLSPILPPQIWPIRKGGKHAHIHTNHWVDALRSHFHWTAFILSAVLFSSLSLCAPHPPFSCLPLLRGAERLALQQQRKDGMSTGFREKWVGGETQRWEMHVVFPSPTSKVRNLPARHLPVSCNTCDTCMSWNLLQLWSLCH